ncbi:hypothetical protein N431DRAFT_104210 [Stipitochalara longipes BDJ]|nr:hypothetical protein N431DRAFT_104210 [Stipitochalara longipes BDJ]
MDRPQTNAQSPGRESRSLLSPSFETHQTGSSRHRSTSVASNRSGITIVDNNSNVPLLNGAPIKRRYTQVVNIKISRWSCLWGFLFGSRITERAAIATVEATEINDEDEDDDNCPFIINVQVLPSSNAASKAHQQARCTFDTGCLQGNIISIEFARKLGFTSADFKRPSSRERNGGTSATGHAHVPEGVLHLTWYHNSSPRLFRNMRFLVSPSEHFDIVIGANSILKYKLLAPPNLGVDSGITTVIPSSDKEYDKLRSAAEKLRTEVETLEHELPRLPKTDETKIKRHESKIKTMKKKLRIACLDRDLYAARKDLASDSKNKEKMATVEDLEQKLEKAKGGLPKTEKDKAASSAPDIKVSEANGKVGAAPPRSYSGGHSRSRM